MRTKANAMLALLLGTAAVCGNSAVRCAPRQAPLGGVVPLRCTLPPPPPHPVAEEIACERVSDFAIPEEYRQNIRRTPGALVLRNIEIRGTTSAAPPPVAEDLCKRLVPEDIRDQLQPIPAAEYRAEYWHSSQKIRYQSMVDGVPMPCSYAEFTVWHPTRTSTRVLADVEARLFRVASKGSPAMLLDARTAFERSRVWEQVKTIEPVTRVYLRYLPTVLPGPGSPAIQRITVRPVWCFFAKERLIGDIISGQRFLIDAVNGTEFRRTFSP